jgi:hydrogenase expression/formation protein HypC
MCIAVPMRVVSIEGGGCCCEAMGVHREVRLDLLDTAVDVGDFVLVHAGYALHAITETEARATWDLCDEITSALDRAEASTQASACFPSRAEGKTR